MGPLKAAGRSLAKLGRWARHKGAIGLRLGALGIVAGIVILLLDALLVPDDVQRAPD